MNIEACEICGEKAFMRCDKHNRCDGCFKKREELKEGINLIHRCEGLWCDNCWGEKMKIKIKEFDKNTSYTDNIFCPYCGYEDVDSWEHNNEGSGDMQCNDCSNTFEFNCHFSVDYSTNKKDVVAKKGEEDARN